MLSDDALLAIFDFCVVEHHDFPVMVIGKRRVEWWQSLVHVCRRWRILVFGSPRRLNLQLHYMTGASARKALDIWPALPLLIQDFVSETSVDNVVAILEHSNRIRQINLMCYSAWQGENEKVLAAMQVPFPELTDLTLMSSSKMAPFLPDSFLGGSAPRLRSLNLYAISFPGLPNLLLSTTHLVNLRLSHITHSAYFSPEAMVTYLSVLTGLESLTLRFESPQSCPDQETRHPLPPTRSILPALRNIWFKGTYEYLEDLVAGIDAPRCHRFSTLFFNDIDFDTPQLMQFISRTQTFKAFNIVHVTSDSRAAWVKLQPQGYNLDSEEFEVGVSCRVPDGQLSFLAQICTSLPLSSTTENLYIYEPEHLFSPLDWEYDIENPKWLELLRPFTALKDLYLDKKFAPYIARALQELTGGRTTDVLPSVKNLFLEGFQRPGSDQEIEGIRQFISARQLINRSVAIPVWERTSR